MKPTRVPILLLMLAASSLSGCATKDTVETRLWVLDALPADTPALAGAEREPPVSVDVASLRLPQYLERPQIVVRTGPNRLVLREYDRWGGSLEKSMTRVLAQNLATLLATPEITVFSRRPPAPAQARLEVEVLQFERVPGDRVMLSAQWRLRASGEGGPPLSRISELESAPVDARAGMGPTVSAMSALLGDLAREVARAVLRREAARSRG